MIILQVTLKRYLAKISINLKQKSHKSIFMAKLFLNLSWPVTI